MRLRAAGQLRPSWRKDNDDRALRGLRVQLPECARRGALQFELTRRAGNKSRRDCCRRGRGTGLGRRGGCLPGVQGSRCVSRGEADEQSRDTEDAGHRRRPPPAGRRSVAALLQNVRAFRRLATPRRVAWPPVAFILAAHLVMVSGPRPQRPRQKCVELGGRTPGLLDANYRRAYDNWTTSAPAKRSVDVRWHPMITRREGSRSDPQADTICFSEDRQRAGGGALFCINYSATSMDSWEDHYV
jgi:hypothetical protein